MRAGHDIAGIHLLRRRSPNSPLIHRGKFDVSRDDLVETLGQVRETSQICIADRPSCGRVGNFAVLDSQQTRYAPLLPSQFDQHLACGSCAFAHSGDSTGGRPTPGRATVVGHLRCVRHHNIDPVNRHPEFFSGRLG